MDVMRQVMRSEGGVIGLYKGLVPTLLREVPGCAAMFAAYEAIKLSAAKQQVHSCEGSMMVALPLHTWWHNTYLTPKLHRRRMCTVGTASKQLRKQTVP